MTINSRCNRIRDIPVQAITEHIIDNKILCIMTYKLKQWNNTQNKHNPGLFVFVCYACWQLSYWELSIHTLLVFFSYLKRPFPFALPSLPQTPNHKPQAPCISCSFCHAIHWVFFHRYVLWHCWHWKWLIFPFWYHIHVDVISIIQLLMLSSSPSPKRCLQVGEVHGLTRKLWELMRAGCQ